MRQHSQEGIVGCLGFTQLADDPLDLFLQGAVADLGYSPGPLKRLLVELKLDRFHGPSQTIIPTPTPDGRHRRQPACGRAQNR